MSLLELVIDWKIIIQTRGVYSLFFENYRCEGISYDTILNQIKENSLIQREHVIKMFYDEIQKNTLRYCLLILHIILIIITQSTITQ